MLQPKRVKYRRPQDGRGNKGNAHRGTQLAFGSFGIKTLESKWLDSRQIEAARVAVNRYMNREGQVWIREGVSMDVAKEALRLAAQKLPVKTKFVIRRDYDKNA